MVGGNRPCSLARVTVGGGLWIIVLVVVSTHSLLFETGPAYCLSRSSKGVFSLALVERSWMVARRIVHLGVSAYRPKFVSSLQSSASWPFCRISLFRFTCVICALVVGHFTSIPAHLLPADICRLFAFRFEANAIGSWFASSAPTHLVYRHHRKCLPPSPSPALGFYSRYSSSWPFSIFFIVSVVSRCRCLPVPIYSILSASCSRLTCLYPHSISRRQNHLFLLLLTLSHRD